jgi:NTP pyrophosphatase (non-canonical NTP hydrolase)
MSNVEHFKKIAAELGELYEKKNKAYGNSFGDTYNKLGVISAVTRISDKYNRLCNLATNPDIDDLGESLEDTLRDMASYCIMTVIEIRNSISKK